MDWAKLMIKQDIDWLRKILRSSVFIIVALILRLKKRDFWSQQDNFNQVWTYFSTVTEPQLSHLITTQHPNFTWLQSNSSPLTCYHRHAAENFRSIQIKNHHHHTNCRRKMKCFCTCQNQITPYHYSLSIDSEAVLLRGWKLTFWQHANYNKPKQYRIFIIRSQTSHNC